MLSSEAMDLAPRVTPTPTDEVRARVPDPDGPRVDGGAAVAEVEPDKDTWSRVFNLVMFVVGAAALAWMLKQTSWGELRDVLLDIGPWAAVILALDVLSMCLDAAAWHALMRPEARMVPYWRVLGAWASGRAINVLTPSGALGEPTKVTMLLDRAPRARVVSSLVLLNLGMLYLSVTIMLIGIPITLLLVDLPDAVKLMIGIGVAVLVPAMVGLALLVRRGASHVVVGALRRIRLLSEERATRWAEKVAEVDSHLRQLYTHQTAGTRLGMLFVASSKLVTYTSSVLLMRVVGVEITPSLVLAVISVGVLIQWISAIIPLGLGLADGGNYALYTLLGASGMHGVFVTMLNRARSVAIALLGLAAMAALTALTRRDRRRIRDLIDTLKARRRRRRRHAPRPPAS